MLVLDMLIGKTLMSFTTVYNQLSSIYDMNSITHLIYNFRERDFDDVSLAIGSYFLSVYEKSIPKDRAQSFSSLIEYQMGYNIEISESIEMAKLGLTLYLDALDLCTKYTDSWPDSDTLRLSLVGYEGSAGSCKIYT